MAQLIKTFLEQLPAKDDEPLNPGMRVVLTRDVAHHLTHVLRLKDGYYVTLSHPEGGHEYRTQLDTRSRELEVRELLPPRNLPTPIRTVCFGLLKGSRTETVLEKCTELGVEHLIVWESERSVAQLGDTNKQQHKRQRWEKILRSAAEQSHQPRVPSLTLCTSLSAYLELLGEIDQGQDPEDIGSGRFVCSLADNAKTLRAFPPSTTGVHLIIGPEGDFSPQELDTLEAHHFSPLSLGPHVLRADTAAIVAAAQIWAGFEP